MVAANGLEAVWFSIRISDWMSCNACQEQHLLKRCLSDGQKCAGTNTDSMRTGGYSIPNAGEIISPDLYSASSIQETLQSLWTLRVTLSSDFSISPKSRMSRGVDSQRKLYSSSTLPLITCRWASLMPVYISAAQFMTKVSKALIILPSDGTNKIHFPFSLWVFKCIL